MPLSVLYLLANVLCLAVLVHRRYWRIAPLFLPFQTITCVQAGVRLYMVANGLDDRDSWADNWATGEVLLLVASVTVALESLWKSLRKIPKSRPWIFFGLCFGIAIVTSCFVSIYWSVDWYETFKQVRAGLFLGLALFTFVGFWGALFYAWQWPRVIRMHAGLLAALFAGHVVMVDYSQWGQSNLNWRIWEMLCCAGWLINCRFLRLEFASIDRKSADDAAPQSGDRQLSRGGFPLGLPPALRAGQER